MTGSRWQFWIDRGGTFTDCVGFHGDTGDLRVTKVLSSDDAPLVGIRALLGLGPTDPIPPARIRLGTTLATNALLERKGRRCALVITRGFADVLEIGDQSRPDIFALEIERPSTLYETVIETDARLSASGAVIGSPDRDDVRRRLRSAHDDGITSVAILVLHAYADPSLERDLSEIAQAIGFEHISTSHDVAAQLGLLARGDTTVVDAYLTPLLRDYLGSLRERLPGSSLEVMQSSGGLVDSPRFRGRDAILSGPAGGAVAVARLADRLELSPAIGFDMGGTSTDVTRYAGELERIYETEVGGIRLRTPMMAIHTVAAGGGSLCRYDGTRLSVGPASAGSDPGPLCYGSPTARELALTDINLVLGRLVGDRFPLPLDGARVQAALAELGRGMEGAPAPLAVAEGFFAVAVDNMAQAIRQITVARGHDVRQHALVVFGGAGGQHACAIARTLGIRTVVVDPLAGVLSAVGIGQADLTWHDERDAGRVGLADTDADRLRSDFVSLSAPGHIVLQEDGIAPDRIETHHRIDLRYVGTETSLTIDADAHETTGEMRRAFEKAHATEFGYARPDHPVEIVALRAEVVGRSDTFEPPRVIREPESPPRGHRPVFIGGTFVDATVLYREDIPVDVPIRGPALVLDETGTTVVEPDWVARVEPRGALVLRDEGATGLQRIGSERDPVGLELMGNRFMSVAEQMGTVLRRTALSTNIRERLDFSCAVFDGSGDLVANAPHLPVHLGAMGESVAAIARQYPVPGAGDVFATNDPAAGGSHLPDITIVTPVVRDGMPLFWVASRGHHADVGGRSPGSMPPDATRLDEEGVVFSGQTIVRGGALDEVGILDVLSTGPYPARNPSENLADLQAQIAANQTGVRLLEELVAELGRDVVEAYMGHVQDHATECVTRVLTRLDPGPVAFTDHNDDGTAIVVTVGTQAGRLRVDFSGTGPAGAHNLNAPRAVTVAAVLYVLRTLVSEPIPLNRGCLRPVDLHIEPGSLLDPPAGHAVAGGNVETSQRVVDVLLGAFGVKAASQGTMNNLTFGDETFGYYETIGGGEGASARADGVSGVHTHMTNTRITDPEVLEARFPVRLVRFSLRRGSGGAGRHAGGDGLVRELEFLAPLRVAILSDRRRNPPFGLAGGAPGATGRTRLGGRDLPGRAQVTVQPGDRLCIETPGGGGFGPFGGRD